MPQPSAGTYYIINRVLGSNRQQLALTYNGEDATVTITPLANLSTQKWIIPDPIPNPYALTPVSPLNDPSFCIGSDQDCYFLLVLDSKNYAWDIIVDEDGITTIQCDAKEEGCWRVDKAASGAKVFLGDYEDEKHNWILVRVQAE